jgi:hypothetical protein
MGQSREADRTGRRAIHAQTATAHDEQLTSNDDAQSGGSLA